MDKIAELEYFFASILWLCVKVDLEAGTVKNFKGFINDSFGSKTLRDLESQDKLVRDEVIAH